jgi:hypothetical protein
MTNSEPDRDRDRSDGIYEDNSHDGHDDNDHAGE